MNNQTKEGWREKILDVINSDDMVYSRIVDIISEELHQAEQRVARDYEDIFAWLLGEKGDFPDLSQKPHYQFRDELRKKLKDIK